MSLKLGAHVDQVDPLAEAADRGADLVQFFLGNPQDYKAPKLAYADGEQALRERSAAAGVDLYVHAPYRLNVANTNNRIRIPSRKLLQQTLDKAAEIAVKGVIVHGGHVGDEDDPEAGSAGVAHGVLDADVGDGARHHEGVDVARREEGGEVGGPGGVRTPRGLLHHQVVRGDVERGVHARPRRTVAAGPGVALGHLVAEELAVLGARWRVAGDHPRDHTSRRAERGGQPLDARHDPADVRRLADEEGHHVDHHERGASRVEVLEGVPSAASGLVPGVLPLLDEPVVVGDVGGRGHLSRLLSSRAAAGARRRWTPARR